MLLPLIDSSCLYLFKSVVKVILPSTGHSTAVSMPFAFLLFVTLAFYAWRVEASSFYVSSTNSNGNDGNAGTDPSLPWATLTRVLWLISICL